MMTSLTHHGGNLSQQTLQRRFKLRLDTEVKVWHVAFDDAEPAVGVVAVLQQQRYDRFASRQRVFAPWKQTLQYAVEKFFLRALF